MGTVTIDKKHALIPAEFFRWILNDVVVYYVPKYPCSWYNGCAQHIPSGKPWLRSVDRGESLTLGHEFGHVLGIQSCEW